MYYNSEWMEIVQTANTDTENTAPNDEPNQENKGGKSNNKNDGINNTGKNTCIYGTLYEWNWAASNVKL